MISSFARLWLVALLAVLGLAAAGASSAATGSFAVTPLVSSNGVPGTLPDSQLVNAWGLGAGPATPWWVADNGTGLSTLYNTATGVTKVGLVVSVGDAPTGLVFNSSTLTGTPGFDVVGGDGGPALFLFDSEAGMISAWNRSLGTAASPVIDLSKDDAVFKGLAIANTTAGPRLYATDFHNRHVDVFDGSWQPVHAPFQFFDPTIPPNYAPFGIQAIGSRVYVTYAKTQPRSDDEQHGPGFGFVDAFDAATGILAGKVAIRGDLNAPWGLAQAPAGFGDLGGDLLVGNFGDGQIHAYAPVAGGLFYLPQGPLRGSDGSPISIDGLWALEFGNGNAAGSTGTLFFTAGPDDESEGLFGSISPAG
jgi:uncharacterized protein (TIGR03118 family)